MGRHGLSWPEGLAPEGPGLEIIHPAALVDRRRLGTGRRGAANASERLSGARASVQRIAQGRAAGFRRRHDRQMGRGGHRRGQRGHQSLLRAPYGDHGRRVRQDLRQQPEKRALASRHDLARDEKWRKLHPGGVHRRAHRQYGNRRLRHVEGRGAPPGAQPRRRMGAGRRARQ